MNSSNNKHRNYAINIYNTDQGNIQTSNETL